MEAENVPRLNWHRVFVIDDDIAVQQFVTETLAQEKLSVEAFTTAKPAIAALGSDHPAIIFLDVALLHSDAIDVLIDLGAHDYGGVVHLMSAGRLQLVEAVQRLGVRHGVKLARPIGKPVTRDDIAQAVANLKSEIAAPRQRRTAAKA